MLITSTIVLYNNNPDVLLQAIQSFLNTHLNVKLYLIDNSPKDTLCSLVTDSRIHYIFNDENLGFGKAHNIGIEESIKASSDFHLILNPDVYFDSNVLKNIVTFMDNNKKFGLLMPKILYPDSQIQYLCKRSPSISLLLLRRFMPTFIQKIYHKKLAYYEYKDHDYNSQIIDVPYLSGCFMFFRTSILNQLKGFDERIFMYMEDADITYRTLQVANTIYYPYVTIYHHFAKGSYKNIKLMFYNIHGAIVYFNKWGWKF